MSKHNANFVVIVKYVAKNKNAERHYYSKEVDALAAEVRFKKLPQVRSVILMPYK